MDFNFETHAMRWVVIPTITIDRGICQDATCEAEHYRVALSWGIWSAAFYFINL